MESGILNPGFWNPEYSLGNPGPNKRLKSRVQDLLKNTGIQYLEYGIQSVESRNPRLSLRRTGYGLTLMLRAFSVIKSGKNDKLEENVAVGSIFFILQCRLSICENIKFSVEPYAFNVHHVHHRVWKCFLRIVLVLIRN